MPGSLFISLYLSLCPAHSLPCLHPPSPSFSPSGVPCQAIYPAQSCLQKWFALLRLHETPLLHNTGSLAQGLPRGPSGRGPCRAVVGVWAAPIKSPASSWVWQDLPWPDTAQAPIKRHWLVGSGSLGRRYRLKPARSPCGFRLVAASRNLQHRFATALSICPSACLRLSLCCYLHEYTCT